MLDRTVTRPERKLVILLRWWIVLFIAAGFVFLFLPDLTLTTLEGIGRTLLKWRGTPLIPSTERFWLVMSLAYMVLITFAAIKAQADIIHNILYVKIIIVGKLASSLGFFLAFFLSAKTFTYLAGTLVDGLIFIITLTAYRKALISRYGK